jgi:hypothetical protein
MPVPTVPSDPVPPNKTRLGTVPMEKKKGGWNLIPTYAKSVGDMVINAGPGAVHFFGGAGVDIVQAFGDIGASLIGVDYQPGYGTTNQLIASAKGTGQLAVDIARRGAAVGRVTPVSTPGGVSMGTAKVEPFSERGAGRYEQAIANNQSILPYIIEDAGNATLVGPIFRGVGKGVSFSGRRVAGKPGAAGASGAAATRGLPGLGGVSQEAATGSFRTAAGSRLQKVGASLINVGDDLNRATSTLGINKIAASPFLPYSLGRKGILNLYRNGIYVGGDSAYIAWGARAAIRFQQQINKLRDQGVPVDDPMIVDLEAKKRRAGNRAMTQQLKKETKEAVRDRGAERGAVVRGLTNEIENALYKDEINPETGEVYGRLTAAEGQAVIAVLNGTAQMIFRLKKIFGDKLTPQMIALLGRYDLYPEFALTPEGADIAYSMLNPNESVISQQVFDRVSYAMDSLGRTIVNSMTDRAIKGYGRRNPLPPEYLVPQPFVEKLGRNVEEALRKAEADLVNAQRSGKATPEQIAALTNNVIAMDNLLSAWNSIVELGITELPLDHPDRINALKSVVDMLPDELALDPSMYSAAQRIPLEFFRRFRAAMGRHIIEGTTFEDGGPTPGGPDDGFPRTPRNAKFDAVDVELAKRERTVDNIEKDIVKIGEKIHKKEEQHVNLVEKIVRYDIVDEYISGKPMQQIADERGVKLEVISKVVRSSPAANTFNRMEKIAKSIREMEAAYDGVVDETELIYIKNQVEGLKAQVAELQQQYEAYKAEEAAARQIAESQEDTLSQELDDLDTQLDNHEAEYELAGGVVDDVWVDETPEQSNQPFVTSATPETLILDAVPTAYQKAYDLIPEEIKSAPPKNKVTKENKEYYFADLPQTPEGLAKAYVYLRRENLGNGRWGELRIDKDSALNVVFYANRKSPISGYQMSEIKLQIENNPLAEDEALQNVINEINELRSTFNSLLNGEEFTIIDHRFYYFNFNGNFLEAEMPFAFVEHLADGKAKYETPTPEMVKAYNDAINDVERLFRQSVGLPPMESDVGATAPRLAPVETPAPTPTEAPQPGLAPIEQPTKKAKAGEFFTRVTKKIGPYKDEIQWPRVKQVLDFFESKPDVSPPTPAQNKKATASYVKSAIKSGRPFHILEWEGTKYFSDSYIVVPVERIGDGVWVPTEDAVYKHTGKETPSEKTTQKGEVPEALKQILDKVFKGKEPYEKLKLVRQEKLATGETVMVFADSTGTLNYILRERFDLFPRAEYYGIAGETKKPIVVKMLRTKGSSSALTMPIAGSGQVKISVEERINRAKQWIDSKASKIPKEVGERIKADLDAIFDQYLLDFPVTRPLSPAEPSFAPVPAAEAPAAPAPAPLRPKAKTPAEVQVDPKIRDEAIQKAVYFADLADAAAADASAALNAAETLTQRLQFLEEYFEQKAKYDVEVNRLAIQLEVSQRARARRDKLEQEIADLRLKQVQAQEGLGPAQEAVESILSSPYYDEYQQLKGNIPLDVAMGDNFPTNVGGYSLPDLEGNVVPLGGPMYVPSGGPKKFFGGVAQDVTEEGLTGWRDLKSEHYRDGDRHVIFSLEQVAIRMGQEVSMMVENERYRFIIATYGETASAILGDEFTQQLYEQAVQWADNYDASTLQSMFKEEWERAQQDPDFVPGIAAYAPGIPSPTQAREFAIRKQYGTLIAEAMKKIGYDPIDPYKDIKALYPERDVNANRLTPVDEGIDPADLEPVRENIVPETMFLPTGMREVMMQVVVPQKNAALTKMLKASAAVTSAMKTTTLVFSIPWQLGDIISSMQIAKAAGIPFSVFVEQLNTVLEQEFGSVATRKDALQTLKRFVIPEIDANANIPQRLKDFLTPEPMTVGPLGRVASESPVQDLGQTAQERAVLYPETMDPKKRLTNRIADKLGIKQIGYIGNFNKAVVGTMYNINASINKLMRHAFFLSKLQESLKARGMTLEQLNNDSAAGWKNDPEIRQLVFDAADSANDWLGDYANLNMKERMYYSQAFPFYSWMRHIHHVFNLVVDTNPDFLGYYMYLGSLYMNAEEDPMNLRRGSISAFGGVSNAGFINPFADVLGGPIASLVLEGNVKPLGQSLGPVPRLVGGAAGLDITKMRSLSRPAGTGSYDEAGNLTYSGVVRNPGEALGFTLQQFPLATRIMNINPTPFDNIPGTRIALGPVSRYQTGEARINPVTGQRLESPGGRLAATARLFGTPLVPYRSDDQINQVMLSARGRLMTLEELLRRREISGAP